MTTKLTHILTALSSGILCFPGLVLREMEHGAVPITFIVLSRYSENLTALALPHLYKSVIYYTLCL